MLNRKELIDLVSHKRSPQGKTVSQDDHAAPVFSESRGCSALEDFTWGHELYFDPDQPLENTQAFSRTASVNTHKTAKPVKATFTEPDPADFHQQVPATVPQNLSPLDSAENPGVESAYHFKLDSDFVFESEERSEEYPLNAGQTTLNDNVDTASPISGTTHLSALCRAQPGGQSGQTKETTVSDLGNEGAVQENSGSPSKSEFPPRQVTETTTEINLPEAKNSDPLDKPAVRNQDPSAIGEASYEPTFEPSDLSFKLNRSCKVDSENGSSPNPKSSELESRAKQLLQSVKQLSLKQVLIPAIMIIVGIVLLYPSSPKPYSVETRLFFISLDGKSVDHPALSMDREIRYFNNTNILYASAQKLFGANQDLNGSQAAGKSKASNATGADSLKTVADGREKFKSSGEFIRWFLKSSSLDADSSSAPARITLKVAGHDPAFLKAVSENYVRAYVDFRRSVHPSNALESRNDHQAGQSASENTAVKAIADRLQNFDFQEREYELALKLMDSGKSPFSGFIPRQNMVDPGALSPFQQKIVQLEINKNSLLLRFSPESREVQTVEQEVLFARDAMRQCVVEQLRFVKQNKEMLLARKSELEIVPSQYDEPKPSPPIPAALGKLAAVNRDGPIYVTEGLYLLWDRPAVVDKPLFAKAADFFKDRMVGNVYRSVDNVRGLKDSVVTGLYHSLVSEDAKTSDDTLTFEADDSPVDNGSAGKGLNRR
ncbi:MAG: hypothetical protein NTW27_07760 [Deltaproteobacteria bacterium]|nr:hypothetical protein [Deltaproteobacteria bacterium]